MPAPLAELDALLHGAATARLSAPGYERFAKGFLRVTGSDATRWLNGMVTNSVQALQPGEGNYNFLLNAQGRIQADCTIYREPEAGEPAFLLMTDGVQVERIRDELDRFIIMDDVELEARSFATTFLLVGPQAPQVLREHSRDAADAVFPGGSAAVRLYLSSGEITLSLPLGQLPAALVCLYPTNPEAPFAAAGVTDVSAEALEAFRILSGEPRYGQDIRNSETARDLPQETNQTHALHFNKGCYLGQEIVERIRSRGQVHRLFTRFALEGDLPPTLPAPLLFEGKPAGELTSVAVVPFAAGPQLLALGYARREFLELRKTFAYTGGTAAALRASDIPATNQQASNPKN